MLILKGFRQKYCLTKSIKEYIVPTWPNLTPSSREVANPFAMNQSIASDPICEKENEYSQTSSVIIPQGQS